MIRSDGVDRLVYITSKTAERIESAGVTQVRVVVLRILQLHPCTWWIYTCIDEGQQSQNEPIRHV